MILSDNFLSSTWLKLNGNYNFSFVGAEYLLFWFGIPCTNRFEGPQIRGNCLTVLKTPWNIKTHICVLNIISAPNSNQILKVKYARFSATYISSSSHSVPRLFCIISQSDPFLEFSFGLELFGRRSFSSLLHYPSGRKM